MSDNISSIIEMANKLGDILENAQRDTQLERSRAERAESEIFSLRNELEKTKKELSTIRQNQRASGLHIEANNQGQDNQSLSAEKVPQSDEDTFIEKLRLFQCCLVESNLKMTQFEEEISEILSSRGMYDYLKLYVSESVKNLPDDSLFGELLSRMEREMSREDKMNEPQEQQLGQEISNTLEKLHCLKSKCEELQKCLENTKK